MTWTAIKEWETWGTPCLQCSRQYEIIDGDEPDKQCHFCGAELNKKENQNEYLHSNSRRLWYHWCI